MPLYEYKCHTCGKTFEELQKFSDEPLKTHPGCGGEVERLLSAPAFHLKGTGWYATDYGKGGVIPKAPDSKSEGGDSKASETKSSDSGKASESKSETKSSDSKSGDTKSSDSKSSDNKSSESKPATVSTADSK